MMPAPDDYLERVYAGVLGKIIGVYLGRPFEGWTHQRIETELGEIWNYVHEQFGVPLVVADDDISGTFTFLRALADHGGTADLTSKQIGLSWLNYIVENRSILWWGGMGNSTEHTAFLRLKSGIPAPLSGAIATNGKTVAEQIGAQIFVDGWALVSPGNPGMAVELARKAASVSHDGEAIYAAQLVAAMEAEAFVNPKLDQLIETGLSYLSPDCLVSRLVSDVRNWHRTDSDWRLTRERIEKAYGYDKFPGNCHVIPNHAIIILSLLYCQDDFRRALMIANTSGWDTDCNSGNVGCLLGIKNGLGAIESKLREPVADRVLLSTADGGRCISDAVRETYEICKLGRVLAGMEPLTPPKRGARFHFDLPGSVQGFRAVSDQPNGLTIKNIEGHSKQGDRSLAIHYHLGPGFSPQFATPTFIPPDSKGDSHYSLMACPTLFSGHLVKWGLESDVSNPAEISLTPFVSYYDGNDELTKHTGPTTKMSAGQVLERSWLIDDLDGSPIVEFGFQLSGDRPSDGTIYLDYVDWKGAPTTSWRRP
ncbi:MAG: ADP-ribosylglycohydrolase family protein, partial [Verrucomicrobia bacterium]|nr:ADP-ribosylglycohydrolase family protein [Verrucomicrobiota bacterium]